VEAFLLRWKDLCGRVIIQYPTEKMEATAKAKYKRVKPGKRHLCGELTISAVTFPRSIKMVFYRALIFNNFLTK